MTVATPANDVRNELTKQASLASRRVDAENLSRKCVAGSAQGFEAR